MVGRGLSTNMACSCRHITRGPAVRICRSTVSRWNVSSVFAKMQTLRGNVLGLFVGARDRQKVPCVHRRSRGAGYSSGQPKPTTFIVAERLVEIVQFL